MSTLVTVDLDQLGLETLGECIGRLNQQAEFLDFCCLQANSEDLDLDSYKWPDRLREAANALRKYNGLDYLGPLMTEGDQ